MAGSSRMPETDSFSPRGTVVSCWMCGIRLHQEEMVPDGSTACVDVRWYCQDSEACTERWTSANHRALAGRASPPGTAVLGAAAGAYLPAAARAASSSRAR
jgi:hypothetical protein